MLREEISISEINYVKNSTNFNIKTFMQQIDKSWRNSDIIKAVWKTFHKKI